MRAWLAGDSPSTVQALKCEVVDGPSVLLKDAWLMRNGMDVHQVSHTYREGNLCVDWVAK